MSTTTQISRPAPFVEQLGTELGKQVIAQQGIPLVAQTVAGLGAAPTQRTGETAEQFKLRQDLFKRRQDAAQMFEDRQTALGALAPQVAQQDALQRQAQQLAQTQAGATGIAGFQPFLTQAQTQAGLAGGLGTAALGTLGGVSLGAPSRQQIDQFMSPFQSQVIQATLDEFDRNKKVQEQQIRDQQAALGVLGAGRAGVQLAEFGTGAARERALLQAGLLQQGFGQAQAARQQDIANRFGISQAQAGLAGQRGALAGAQQGLGGFQAQLGAQQQALTGRDVSQLGTLGAINQAQAQAEADASREAARQAAFLPQQQLDRYAAQVTGLMGGYPGQTQQSFVPNPTPLQTALGIGTTLAGLYLGRKDGGRIGYADGSDKKEKLKGIMQMAEIDMLQDEYDQYVFELKEQRPDATPMTFEEFRRMVLAGQG